MNRSTIRLNGFNDLAGGPAPASGAGASRPVAKRGGLNLARQSNPQNSTIK